ncbi:MAG: KAP family NTPase [Coriobacteriales bacterium]|jgi:ABC-type dipeptide/oligopeptide/nickel transport system ATPase component|nr:KAP family NTPase [Coriobacteriales bacterium]
MGEQTAVGIVDLKLISDHTDESGTLSTELLERQGMANAIAKAIMEVEPPFTLGIYGGWGSGKTYFMKLIKQRLESPDDEEIPDDKEKWNPKVIPVMFEAWQYQRDEHPEIAMLQCLRKELESLAKRLEMKKRVARTIFAGLDAAIKSITEISFNILGLINVKVSPSKAYEAFIKEKEAKKREEFGEVDWHTILKEKFCKALEDVARLGKKNTKPEYRIVFFIDDLDRCLDDAVIDILEKIKLLLWSSHCVFVLGADHKVIEGIVENKRGVKDGNKYLEKIINFPVYLPPVGEIANEKFFSEKMKGMNEEIIELFKEVSDAARANLRLMVQLINAFKLNRYMTRELLQAKGAHYDERITAVLTALQTLDEDVFNRICEKQGIREENLKLIFKASTQNMDDPFAGLLNSENSEVIETIRNAANAYSLDVDAIDFSTYVEFPMAQSAAKYEAQEDPSIGVPQIVPSNAPWEWYEKDPSYSAEASDAVDAINIAIAKIKAIATNNVLDKSRLISIDGYLWRVIEINKGIDDEAQEALLLSEHIIGRGIMDYEPENWNSYLFQWANCALNEELNSERWLNAHLPTLNKSGKLQENHVLGKRKKSDPLRKVFLPSASEVEDDTLFPGKLRMAVTCKGEAGWWWLRSRDVGRPQLAAYVYSDGEVNRDGWRDVYDAGGVRPALWLNLTS